VLARWKRPLWDWNWLVFLAVLVLFPLALTAQLAIGIGSLWVDELHSSWVIWERLSQVPERSWLGHQSPLYFAGLWCWWQLPLRPQAVPPELWLRLPSLIAWWGLLISGVVMVRGQCCAASRLSWPVGGVAIATVALVERVGLFYATEVRPYAVAAAISLPLAWLANRCDRSPKGLDQPVAVRPRPGGRRLGVLRDCVPTACRWAWLLFAWTLFYLHPTAALVAGASWLARGWSLACGGWSPRSSSPAAWLSDGLLLVGGCAVGLPWWLESGRQRQAWGSFAGEVSLTAWWGLLPITSLAIIPLLAGLLAKRLAGGTERSDRWWHAGSGLPAQWVMMVLVPLVGVWLLTATGWPLMHRRYVIASYGPLLAIGLLALQQLPSGLWRIGVMGMMIGWMVAGQGTWRAWQAGYGSAAVRDEPWREIALEVAALPGQVDRWLAPGWIETAGQTLPPDLSDRELGYLTSPARSLYRFGPAFPRCLPNLPEGWAGTLSQHYGCRPISELVIVYRLRSHRWPEQRQRFEQRLVARGWRLEYLTERQRAGVGMLHLKLIPPDGE
jgi:hypothetical protein